LRELVAKKNGEGALAVVVCFSLTTMKGSQLKADGGFCHIGAADYLQQSPFVLLVSDFERL